MPFFDVVVIFCPAVFSVIVAVRLVGRSPAFLNPPDKHDDQITYLFDKDMLHHVSGATKLLLDLTPGKDDWQSLRHGLKDRFPSLPRTPEEAAKDAVIVPAVGPRDFAALILSQEGPYTRVILETVPALDSSADVLEELAHAEQEVEVLQLAASTALHPMWQIDLLGQVTWKNRAYEKLFHHIHGSSPNAESTLFEGASAGFDPRKGRRISLKTPGGQQDWYDLHTVDVGDVTMCHATNINPVVEAEIAQRNFVQTLAKTFAHLSIGLAIFDRKQQLVLFNPALIDLTALPAEFLSARPTLMSFFDRIRENRTMPEPKNYKSWRLEITEVIAAATDGRYQETWTLETGQTYRVRGRPHPDGAIAFLVEDISAEMSLTRNFRAELEMGQSLMDTFDDALVVFSTRGVLTFCNKAYRDMWGLDPDSSFADVTIVDSVFEWKRQSAQGPDWDRLMDFVLAGGDRSAWRMDVITQSKVQMISQVEAVASGATLVRFSKSRLNRTAPVLVSDSARLTP